jgi:hypothetical protein
VEKAEGNRPLGKPERRWAGNLKCVLKRWDRKMWTVLMSIRTGTGGRLL